MPRYKLTIEYDGRPFVGWQVQDNGISVQGVLAAAVAAFCGETVHVQGAGRTDAGVHALGQVAHVDLAKAWEADTVRDALNACLRPHPVAVLAAEPAAENFDARFSALKRHYLYRIVNRRADLALDAGRALRVPRPLDADAMHAAAPAPRGPARLHDIPRLRVPGEIAREDARSARRRTPRRRPACARFGALVPAPPGALDGRLAHPRRRRPLERRRSRSRARGMRPQGLRPGRPAGWAVFGAGGLLKRPAPCPRAPHVAHSVIPGRALARTAESRLQGPHARRLALQGSAAARCPGMTAIIRNTDPKSSGRSR